MPLHRLTAALRTCWRPADNGAKQTQFPATPGPTGLGGRETIVRNKPNLGPSPERSDSLGKECETNPIPGEAGWGDAPGAWDAGQSCRTNPISAEQGQQGRSAAPNKANSAKPAGGPGPWEGQTCETNPICAKRNRWAKPRPTRGRDCAKRTQFRRPGRGLGRRGTRANRATSPRCPASGNKPNFRRAGSVGPVRRTKQSQFPPPRRLGPAECAKQSQSARQIAPNNKANPSGAGRTRFWGQGAIVQNKANSAKPAGGPGPWAREDVRNKPNSVRGSRQPSAWREKSYG